MEKQHHYATTIRWTGNTGRGTASYTSYERAHTISAAGRPDILSSSDPGFRGDPSRYNPEELFLSSLSSCHMLWYLHLCAVNGIVVTAYTDRATGVMQETAEGGGYFTEVTLHPEVAITDASKGEKALALHEEANRMCFLARSVKFPVHHKPVLMNG